MTTNLENAKTIIKYCLSTFDDPNEEKAGKIDMIVYGRQKSHLAIRTYYI